MEKQFAIKVLIVDDHNVIREGLQRILEQDNEIEVVGEAENGKEAVEKAIFLSPDVILMDIQMPNMDGITATTAIKEKLPSVNIMMLTLYAEDYIEKAIEAGASGYLLKDSSFDQIIQGIHQIYCGLSPIDPSLTREFVKEYFQLRREKKANLLSERQPTIMAMVAEGRHSREISNQLFISPSTLKRDLRHIFNKLGAKDRAEAVFLATSKKLI